VAVGLAYLGRTRVTNKPSMSGWASKCRWRLIHKSNLMTVTTPSPSDVSVTL